MLTNNFIWYFFIATISYNIKAGKQKILKVRHMPIPWGLTPTTYFKGFIRCEAEMVYWKITMADWIIDQILKYSIQSVQQN